MFRTRPPKSCCSKQVHLAYGPLAMAIHCTVYQRHCASEWWFDYKVHFTCFSQVVTKQMFHSCAFMDAIVLQLAYIMLKGICIYMSVFWLVVNIPYFAIWYHNTNIYIALHGQISSSKSLGASYMCEFNHFVYEETGRPTVWLIF